MRDIFFEERDYTYLDWNKIRSSSGTAGSFLKSTEIKNRKKVYYKLSNYNSVEGIVGHECINEIIAGRLMDVLGIEHLEYRLLHGKIKVNDKIYTTYFCVSDSFRKEGERKITLEDYYQLLKRDNETVVDFVIRHNFEEKINQMILVDYLILNRDRHGANIELIRDRTGEVKTAPLFDHGVSLLFNCHDDAAVENFDVMEDRPIQSFLGTHSAVENLNIIQNKMSINKLNKKDKEYILYGIDKILSKKHMDKIWQMIWERWNYYESLFNL